MQLSSKTRVGWHPALLALLVMLGTTTTMTGCATRDAPASVYDFGPLSTIGSHSTATTGTPPALAIAAVQAPTALNNTFMLFRLVYANDLQPHSYKNSRWSMPPAQLLEQRLKARLAQAGIAVLSGGEGGNTLPVLRIEVDELIQNFSSAHQSDAQLALRATLFSGRTLLAQKSFREHSAAASADASGGARAMANASDALIDALIAWLATVPLQK